MGRQDEVDVIDISANPRERVSKPSHGTIRSDEQS
jgi:hypothetical protein